MNFCVKVSFWRKQLHSGVQVHCEGQPGTTWCMSGRSQATGYSLSAPSHLSQQWCPEEVTLWPPSSSTWSWSSGNTVRGGLITLLPLTWDEDPYVCSTCILHFSATSALQPPTTMGEQPELPEHLLSCSVAGVGQPHLFP